MERELFDRVARKAYDIYEKRGAGHGSHFDDWVEAERLVMAEIEREKAAKKAAQKTSNAGTSPKTSTAHTAKNIPAPQMATPKDKPAPQMATAKDKPARKTVAATEKKTTSKKKS